MGHTPQLCDCESSRALAELYKHRVLLDAAPELLEALKQLVWDATDTKSDHYKKAVLAIDKAEGRG